MKHDAELLSHIAPKYGRLSSENLTGYTMDLSEYLEFDFYDPVWYWDTLSGEKSKALTGIWIRISHRVGKGMYYWVLNKQGSVISRYKVQHLTKEDILNPISKETLC